MKQVATNEIESTVEKIDENPTALDPKKAAVARYRESKSEELLLKVKRLRQM